MPVRDYDPPFVAGVVAVFKEPFDRWLSTRHEKKPQRYHPGETVENLHAIQAFPIACVVQPKQGYGAALSHKIAGQNKMASETRKRTGANLRYVAEGGQQARNMIWEFAMGAALNTCLPMLVMRERVVPDRVEIFIHRKELSDETRHLLRTMAMRWGLAAHKNLLEVMREHPQATRPLGDLAKAVRIDPKMVSVQWSDEPGFSGAERGILLADSWASHFLAAIKGARSQAGFLAHLDRGGFREYMLNITDLVIAPPHPATVKTWETRMGLPSPYGVQIPLLRNSGESAI